MNTQEKIKALSPRQQRIWGALVLTHGLTEVQAYEKVIKMNLDKPIPNEKLPSEK